MFMGKTVVITGAASGIGKGLAEKFLEEGAVVWACDINAEALAKMAWAAKKVNQSLRTFPLDVSDANAVRHLGLEVSNKEGSLDYWINNAGIGGLGSFKDLSPEEFHRVVAINLNGVIAGTRVALTHMEPKGAGTIVNMASVAGHVAPPFMTAYATTKHAVVGFTRSLREELRMNESPVKLVMVSPGFVDTAILAKGKKIGFPPWLEWALSSPKSVVSEIFAGLVKGEEEIFPTRNGRVMLRCHRMFPNTTVRSSKALLAKSFKDFILNRYNVS